MEGGGEVEVVGGEGAGGGGGGGERVGEEGVGGWSFVLMEIYWGGLEFLRGNEGMVIQFAGVRVLHKCVFYSIARFNGLAISSLIIPPLLWSNTRSYLAMESHFNPPQGSLKSASAFSNAVTTLPSILILSATQPFCRNDEIREG